MRIKFVSNNVLTNPGSTTLDEWTFNANSLFDPFGAHAATQPLFFDQYALLYNKYKVHGAAIKITVINNQSAPTNVSANFRVTVMPTTDSEAITNGITLPQYPYAKEQFAFLNTRVCRMKHYMSTRKVYGTQVKDTNYEATIGSNPTNLWYWRVFVQRFDQSSMTAGDYKIEVKLIQYATMFDREYVVDA